MDYKEYYVNPKTITGNKPVDVFLTKLGFNEKEGQFLLKGHDEYDWHLLPGAEGFVQFFHDLPVDTPLCIAGDYDADGVTSTSILYLSFKAMGFKDIHFYIPHRVEDGYGLSRKVIDKILDAYPDTKVIITCDNGCVAQDAVEYALSKGLQVCVTDHHELQESSKKIHDDVSAFVHPRYGKFAGFGDISGAEVTYKLSQGMLEDVDDSELKEYLLQLATISVVSDVMPVASTDKSAMEKNENRELLRKGLKSMHEHLNFRLKVLADLMMVDVPTMDESTIGFYIAPAINAVGRLTSAKTAVQFLISEDEESALMFATQMVYLNDERKRLREEGLESIKPLVDESHDSILVKKEGLLEGIIGILAGNLEDEYQKPTIVFTKCTINGKPAWKGSARSVDDVNIFNVLNTVQTETNSIYAFGGHAGAAGLSVLDENWDDFEKSFYTHCHSSNPLHKDAVKWYQVLYAGDIESTAEELKKIKPFGNGLPHPLFQSRIYINDIALYFKSGSVRCRSVFGKQVHTEFWLYKQDLEKFKENYCSKFEQTFNNLDEKRKLLPPNEAYDTHCEYYKKKAGEKPVFTVTYELDYGPKFSGGEGSLMRVEKMEK